MPKRGAKGKSKLNFSNRTKRHTESEESLYSNSVIHRFKRHWNDDINISLGVASTGNYTGAFSFSIDKDPAYAELVALFDCYRIRKVKMQIMPRYNSVDVFEATDPASQPMTSYMAPYVSVVDYDDATTSTYVQIEEYETARWHNPRVPCQIVVRPIAAQAVFDGVTTAYNRCPRSTWMDLAYPSVPHYGIKIAFKPLDVPVVTAKNDIIYDVRFTMYIECKNSR